MIKNTNLTCLIDALIKAPGNTHLLDQIASAANNFKELVLNNNGKSLIRRRKKNFFCHQTNYLVRLIDKLYLEFRSNRHPGLAKALIMLKNLAEELIVNVPVSRDKVLLPNVLRDRERGRIHQEGKVIQKWLSCAYVDPELIELILLPLDDFCCDATVSYQDYCYLRQHIQWVEKTDLRYIRGEEATEKVQLCMIRANFNNLQFIIYCIDRLKVACSGSSFDNIDIKCARNYLLIQKRKYKNIATTARFSYDNRFISVQKNILNWLREENRKLSKELA